MTTSPPTFASTPPRSVTGRFNLTTPGGKEATAEHWITAGTVSELVGSWVNAVRRSAELVGTTALDEHATDTPASQPYSPLNAPHVTCPKPALAGDSSALLSRHRRPRGFACGRPHVPHAGIRLGGG